MIINIRINTEKSNTKSKFANNFPLKTSFEQTTLVDKAQAQKESSINVIGGIGLAKGVPYLDFSDMPNFLTKFLKNIKKKFFF